MNEIKAVKVIKKVVKPKIKPVSLIKKLHELAPTATTAHISHYLFQLEDGEIKTHFNDVCYARFHSGMDKNYNQLKCGIIKARVYLNQWPKHFKTPKEVRLYKKYIDWVVNKSPWKDAFLNGKSDYFKDGLAINCNQVHQYVFGAMTAIREPLEYRHQVVTFDTLTKKGISPELAHVIGGLSMSDGAMGGRGGGHSVFDADFSVTSLKQFKVMDHQFKNKKPLNQDATEFYGLQKMFVVDGMSLVNILAPLGKQHGAGWQQLRKVDWNVEQVITILKEIDNA